MWHKANEVWISQRSDLESLIDVLCEEMVERHQSLKKEDHVISEIQGWRRWRPPSTLHPFTPAHLPPPPPLPFLQKNPSNPLPRTNSRKQFDEQTERCKENAASSVLSKIDAAMRCYSICMWSISSCMKSTHKAQRKHSTAAQSATQIGSHFT